MDPRQQILKSFQEVTGCQYEESTFYLDAANWDVNTALNMFSSDSNQKKPPTVSKPSSSVKAETKRNVGVIKGLSDYKDEEEDEDTVKWYAGGEKSGIQVQAPKKSEEAIDDVMKTAKKSGAVHGYDYKSEDQSFTGGGYRLGASNVPTTQVPSTKNREVRVKIVFWKNGFTVSDGPLRSFNDPDNQTFLDSVSKGLIPTELESYGKDIAVDLIDSRGEDYKPPPVVISPFSGSGQKLGSTSSVPIVATIDSGEDFKVEEGQPTTNIQIRLEDGTRLVGKFNHGHCVKHIRSYINKMKPTKASYYLCTTFPQKILTDENQTLTEAKLLNSVVVQKLT